MNTNRIFLDDSSISGRLRSNWSTRPNFDQRSRPVSTTRRDYSGMIGQDISPPKISELNTKVTSLTSPSPNPTPQKNLKTVACSAEVSSTHSMATHEQRSVMPQLKNQKAQALNHNDKAQSQQFPSMVYSSTIANAEQSTLAKQFNLQVPSITKSKFALSGKLKKVGSNLTTAISVLVFVAGIYVIVDGYMANKQVKAQVEQVSAAIDNGGVSPEGLPSETPPSESIEKYNVAADMPRYLEISSIGVKSRVIRMGVTPGGAVQAPSNIFDSGWYDGSAKPGQPGAAFIDGHVSGVTQPGVFKSIKTLKSGDLLTIEMGDSTKYQYKVVKSESYPADAVDMTKVLAPVNSGKQGLNLMTCSGAFDTGTNQYKERLVVFTERI